MVAGSSAVSVTAHGSVIGLSVKPTDVNGCEAAFPSNNTTSSTLTAPAAIGVPPGPVSGCPKGTGDSA